jgi:superfamily II DNA or RNA helicase
MSKKLVVHISRNGSYIDASKVTNEFAKKVKRFFTIRCKNIMGYYDITTGYKQIKNRLYIPRFGSFLLGQKIRNLVVESDIPAGDHVSSIEEWNGSLKHNQNLVLQAIMESYYNDKTCRMGGAGLILNLEAGQGKTYVAMALMSRLSVKTLIVVHNTTMLSQWAELLKECFPSLEIGYYYGKKKQKGDVTICVINSLTCSKNPLIFSDGTPFLDFLSGVGFCVFDECHEYCSKKRRTVFDKCQSMYMLGLSATPEERLDKLDNVIKWNIGPVLKASDITEYKTGGEVLFKGHVSMIKYYGPEEYTRPIYNMALEMISVPLMIEQLVNDPYRTNIILEYAEKYAAKGMNIFIFADRRSYLETIEKNLNTKCQYMTKDLDTITVMGGSKDADMKRAKERCNIILSTYQFISTGTSIPKMNCVILATPRKTKSRQFINRIFRLGGDNNIEREIVDIVDMRTCMKNQWYARKKYYQEKNFTIDAFTRKAK